MKIVGIDTGEKTGVVIFSDETREVIERMTVGSLVPVWAKLGQYLLDDVLVVLERTPARQKEYQAAVMALDEYGYNVYQVSPGQWKPNPRCRCYAKDYPGWTSHERDAMSLVKYYLLQRKASLRGT